MFNFLEQSYRNLLRVDTVPVKPKLLYVNKKKVRLTRVLSIKIFPQFNWLIIVTNLDIISLNKYLECISKLVFHHRGLAWLTFVDVVYFTCTYQIEHHSSLQVLSFTAMRYYSTALIISNKFHSVFSSI